MKRTKPTLRVLAHERHTRVTGESIPTLEDSAAVHCAWTRRALGILRTHALTAVLGLVAEQAPDVRARGHVVEVLARRRVREARGQREALR